MERPEGAAFPIARGRSAPSQARGRPIARLLEGASQAPCALPALHSPHFFGGTPPDPLGIRKKGHRRPRAVKNRGDDARLIVGGAVTCYVISMPTARRQKKSKPRTPRQRMAARRQRLRAQGLRPVQHWVPDLRDPKVLADLRRQAKLLARHPENAEVDAWIEAMTDFSEWR